MSKSVRDESDLVIRNPKVLSDYPCSACEKRGKRGVMRYKGTKRGRVTATYEEFDECAPGGYKLQDRTVGIDVHVWGCDNCASRNEDTLGY